MVVKSPVVSDRLAPDSTARWLDFFLNELQSDLMQ